MRIAEAQQDNRRAFVRGGPGAFVAEVLWLGAALVLKDRGIAQYLKAREAERERSVAQKRRVAEAQESFAKRETKKAREDARIGTKKAQEFVVCLTDCAGPNRINENARISWGSCCFGSCGHKVSR